LQFISISIYQIQQLLAGLTDQLFGLQNVRKCQKMSENVISYHYPKAEIGILKYDVLSITQRHSVIDK